MGQHAGEESEGEVTPWKAYQYQTLWQWAVLIMHSLEAQAAKKPKRKARAK